MKLKIFNKNIFLIDFMADDNQPVCLQSSCSAVEEAFLGFISKPSNEILNDILMIMEKIDGKYVISFGKFRNQKKSKSFSIFYSNTFNHIYGVSCEGNIVYIRENNSSDFGHKIELPTHEIAKQI